MTPGGDDELPTASDTTGAEALVEPTAPRSSERRSDPARGLLLGGLVGLAGLVALSAVLEVLDRQVDDLDETAWVALPLVVLPLAYAISGYVAGHAWRDLAAGPLAALLAFGAWVAIRGVVALAGGADLDLGPRALASNLLLAGAFGIFGGMLGTRAGSGRSGSPEPSEREPSAG